MRVDVQAAAAREVAEMLVHVPMEFDALAPVAAATDLRPPFGAGRLPIVFDVRRVPLKDGASEPLQCAAWLRSRGEPIGRIEREGHRAIGAQYCGLGSGEPQFSAAKAKVESVTAT